MKGFLKVGDNFIKWSNLLEHGSVKMELGKLVYVDPKLSGVLYLDDSVICLGAKCFNGCRRLQFIVLNDTLQLIGSFAFAMCTELQTLTIPGSVTRIGTGITLGCSSLEKLIVDPSNAYYESGNNCISQCGCIIAGCKESSIRNKKAVASYAFGGITRDHWDVFNVGVIKEDAFPACNIEDLLISTDDFTQCKIEPGAFKNANLKNVTLSGNIAYEEGAFGAASIMNAEQVMNVDFGGDIQQIAIFGGDHPDEV